MRHINLLLSVTLLFFGCASSIDIVKNPNITVKGIKKVVILDIECGQYIDCAYSTGRLENAFLKNGIDVLDRKYFDLIVKEQGISLTGLTEEKLIEIGKMISAQVVVTGKITINDLTLKLISVETGQIICNVYSQSRVERTIQKIIESLS